MEDLSLLMNGFATVLSWQNIGLMAIGILLGIVVGVLPGLGGPNGVAILLPPSPAPSSARWWAC
jgi:putative tricarboxylic transport membrane protein